VDYGRALEDGKLVPCRLNQPGHRQLHKPLQVAAPKDATETVPVHPVTLDVVAMDQTPSVAELNTQKHLTAVTPTVTVNCIPSAVYIDTCIEALH